jgi:hypothetical protein
MLVFSIYNYINNSQNTFNRSAPFNIDEVGRVHVKVEKSDEVIDLIRTEILLEDATVFVILNKEEGKWPYRIENYSDVNVDFYQQVGLFSNCNNKFVK